MDPSMTAAPERPEPPASGYRMPRRLTLRFVGSGSEYFRIWIVNLLLTLVTLGLYYPFAKVRRLKYFHGATELAGQPFSFHADPWKMLRGYLLVGVMMVLYGVAGQVSPEAGLVALAIVAAIWPALWHSSLRFRFANTGWRGLRFHFRGTRGGAYKVMGWAALGFGVFFALLMGAGFAVAPSSAGGAPGAASGLVAVVFGVVALLLYFAAVPVMLWLMHGYRQRHLALGSEHSTWSVRPGGYIKLALKTVAVSLLPVMLLGVAAAVLLPGLRGFAGAGAGGFVAIVGVMVLYVVLIAVAGGYFTARLQDLMWNGTRSPHIVIASALPARATILLWIRNWLLTIVTLGLYFPFAQVAMARLRLQAVSVELGLPLDELTAQLEGEQESAAGDAAGDLLGWDIGL